MENLERHHGRVFSTIALLYLITAIAPSAVMATVCEPWNTESASNSSLRVGSVQVNVNDVFNNNLDAENQPIHRLANQLHVQSRQELIEAQLLFSQGEPFDADLLAETERNLRSNKYLRSASVTPKQICDGEVDILVETGDNWSLIPSFNFSRAGGENRYSFSLAELNLFGRGKSLGLSLDYSAVRDQRVLLYQDPMLFGTNTQFSAQLQDNSDGQAQVFEFKQPFTSLDSQRSWQVRVGNSEYVQSLYDDGRVVNQLNVDNEIASLSIGASKGRQFVRKQDNGRNVNRVFRWSAGWSYQRQRLTANARFPDAMPVPERIFSYPFVDFKFLQPEFIELSNLQVMESVEDIDVGHQFSSRLGWAAEALGSSKDSLVATANYAKGWRGGDRFLSLLSAGLEGYVNDDSVENGIAKATAQHFYFVSPKNSLYASTNLVATNKLFELSQVVIGGATGLRGYPLNFQTGSRRARFTLEHRYFFDWYPLRLARIGTATFADAGAAWDKGEDPQWLKDVGVGIRIVGTRQADAQVLHLDFAFPLDETDRISSFQFVVTAKSQF